MRCACIPDIYIEIYKAAKEARSFEFIGRVAGEYYIDRFSASHK